VKERVWGGGPVGEIEYGLGKVGDDDSIGIKFDMYFSHRDEWDECMLEGFPRTFSRGRSDTGCFDEDEAPVGGVYAVDRDIDITKSQTLEDGSVGAEVVARAVFGIATKVVDGRASHLSVVAREEECE
jgi:hypothetical protein